MNKADLNNRVFHTLLKAAVSENFERELADIPQEEKLKEINPVSKSLSQRIQEIIHKEYHRARFRQQMRIVKKVAIIVAIIIPISLGSLLSVEASRTAIFNAIMEWKSDHIDIHYQDVGASSNLASSNAKVIYRPKYIPHGFSESQSVQNGATYRIRYKNADGITISFDQISLPEDGKTMLDTEHTIYRKITINGQEASLFEAKTPQDKTYILWKYSQISLKLYSKIDSKELIKMAESIGK